ncbi:MAG: cytochrome d ubiquinol oxidase subunit II [Alicyclobacillaceae bacterium]|jgi:cytochrome d ubiquinol oxidase subunit II|nr:cytochrome d ubiquinol oxidase subunit II [Alicyclobacillaceae bacterium]
MLNTVWFVMIAVLFTGFFVLEGFDFGVGILAPFLGKTDTERRLLINTIGPFWDGNEVWFVAAGGAMFAAFPNWYATLFSGFYIALFLLVLALILRGVGFEFRSKVAHAKWRTFWDWAIFSGSVFPPMLWGVALANMMKGIPINAQMQDVGTFWQLLSPYSIAGGLAMTLLFMLHGAIFLTLRTHDDIRVRARSIARKVGVWTTIMMFVFIILSYFYTNMFTKEGIVPGPTPVLAGFTLVSLPFLIRYQKDGWAFLMSTFTVILSSATVFLDLFPRVMVSSLNPAWSLTIYNAAANSYSLKVMTICALTLLPFVLAYQAWTFWIFRKRLSIHDELDY